ncbi:hypothetical protein DMB38_20615 [Streptomyces sp. WAC 06738]|uniref:recombinase family protein n=1 Tax=Streptomyces sp. WAC 06738 TaxID=2203210 RepID=UPI000F6C8A5E|nr:recombinase family protein [Streptomyces sp. WAC 06738]AZM47874.1 hypothetical protein DMB38_20615 [Streptomyces sp. WAC 06738]
MKIKAWSPAQLGKVPLVVFLYVRVSLGRDIMDSPETQEKNGELTAKLLGVKIKEIVPDIDESGQFFGHRKVLWMIEQIRQGAANGIMVLDTSRWGRNLMESRQYVKELYDAGGVLISMTQPIDPTTADGLMIMNHFMNMDEHQGNKIGESWVRAHNMRKDNGKPHHGREVFGYKRCPDCRRSERNKRAYEWCKTCEGVLQVDEDVELYYRNAFKDYNANRKSMQTIVREGNALGITTVNGNPLSVSGLRNAMDSGFAAGFVRVNDPTQNSRTSTPWDWKSWKRGKHKRIISLGTWMRYVQKRRKQSRPESRNIEPAYSLSTLMRCGRGETHDARCLASMHANPHKRADESTFRCSNESQGKGCQGITVTIVRAERLVLEWVADRARGEEQAALEMKRSAQANFDMKELRKLEKRKKALKTQQDRLLDALLDGVFTKEQVRKKQDELNTDLSIVEQKLSMLGESIASNQAPPAEAFQGFLALWPKLTVVEKQKSLSVIIDHIVVYPTPAGMPNRLEIVPKWAPLEDRLITKTKNWDRIRAQRAAAA